LVKWEQQQQQQQPANSQLKTETLASVGFLIPHCMPPSEPRAFYGFLIHLRDAVKAA